MNFKAVKSITQNIIQIEMYSYNSHRDDISVFFIDGRIPIRVFANNPVQATV